MHTAAVNVWALCVDLATVGTAGRSSSAYLLRQPLTNAMQQPLSTASLHCNSVTGWLFVYALLQGDINGACELHTKEGNPPRLDLHSNFV